MNTKRRPWTDEEYGFLLNSDLPAERIAEELGRPLSSVYSTRIKLRAGWSPAREAARPYAQSDDNFIVQNPLMSAHDVAKHLGRTAGAVNQRRMNLRRTRGDIPMFPNNLSPHVPGARPVIAMTCPECGLLLQAKWFPRNGKFHERKCSRCKQGRKLRLGSADTNAYTRSAEAVARWQQITSEQAENRGKPWLEADMVVLADPDMTILQKALALKRTYLGTSGAVIKFGYPSSRRLGDPERDQWLIDNPNMGNLEFIARQVDAMYPAAEDVAPAVERELVPAGNVRPDFEWDD